MKLKNIVLPVLFSSIFINSSFASTSSCDGTEVSPYIDSLNTSYLKLDVLRPTQDSLGLNHVRNKVKKYLDKWQKKYFDLTEPNHPKDAKTPKYLEELLFSEKDVINYNVVSIATEKQEEIGKQLNSFYTYVQKKLCKKMQAANESELDMVHAINLISTNQSNHYFVSDGHHETLSAVTIENMLTRYQSLMGITPSFDMPVHVFQEKNISTQSLDVFPFGLLYTFDVGYIGLRKIIENNFIRKNKVKQIYFENSDFEFRTHFIGISLANIDEATSKLSTLISPNFTSINANNGSVSDNKMRSFMSMFFDEAQINSKLFKDYVQFYIADYLYLYKSDFLNKIENEPKFSDEEITEYSIELGQYFLSCPAFQRFLLSLLKDGNDSSQIVNAIDTYLKKQAEKTN